MVSQKFTETPKAEVEMEKQVNGLPKMDLCMAKTPKADPQRLEMGKQVNGLRAKLLQLKVQRTRSPNAVVKGSPPRQPIITEKSHFFFFFKQRSLFRQLRKSTKTIKITKSLIWHFVILPSPTRVPETLPTSFQSLPYPWPSPWPASFARCQKKKKTKYQSTTTTTTILSTFGNQGGSALHSLHWQERWCIWVRTKFLLQPFYLSGNLFCLRKRGSMQASSVQCPGCTVLCVVHYKKVNCEVCGVSLQCVVCVLIPLFCT